MVSPFLSFSLAGVYLEVARYIRVGELCAGLYGDDNCGSQCLFSGYITGGTLGGFEINSTDVKGISRP